MGQAIVLLLAGGVGSRIGKMLPKQYIEVDGRMIIDRCMERVLECNLIDGLWVVAEDSWQDRIINVCTEPEKIRGFSRPGENRAQSIFHGLEDLATHFPDNTVVIVHDAARPMVSKALLSLCVEGCKIYDGVMPVLPMKDTVYYSSMDGNAVESLLDRRRVYAGQAPEAYRLGKYLKAYERLSEDELCAIHGSTEPAVMAGMRIQLIPGDEDNFKITTAVDLERYKDIISLEKG